MRSIRNPTFLLIAWWNESEKAIMNGTIYCLQCKQFQFVDSVLFHQPQVR